MFPRKHTHSCFVPRYVGVCHHCAGQSGVRENGWYHGGEGFAGARHHDVREVTERYNVEDGLAQLGAAGFSPAATDGGVGELFGDDHQVWASHSGGAGHHSEPEWDAGDAERAETYYAQVRGKAKIFLDLLIDHPGRRLSTDQIRRLTPNVFDSDYAIAGSIKGLANATSASGRRYPFYWWKDRPTSYAMKPGVAAVFAAARERIGR